MKAEKKICVFGTRGFPFIQGGVEKHCELLYPLFGKEFQFVIFRRKPYVSREARAVSYPNIRFVDLPSTKIKGFEAEFHSFLATILSIGQRPGIVHIHNIGAALFSPVLRLCGIKVVLTYHSANYEHKKWGAVGKFVLRMSEKVALKMANAVIFVNKFQMEKYPKIRKKSCYIPNGISGCQRSEGTEHLSEWHLSPQKYILSVGRITQEKGFDCLIRAFGRIVRKDYKLVIAGGTEAESSYARQLMKMADPGRVVFTGFVYGEKLRQLYSHAALYVLASSNEGFPLVLLEAMGYRLRILASDIPACHLVDIGENHYFPVGDDVVLSRRMAELLDGDARPQEYDLSAYDWDRIARQVAEVYAGVLKSHRHEGGQ